MRVRALSPTGDYVFGRGVSEFLINTPQAVGQVVSTRLLLQLGEMFYATNEGVPYATQVVGFTTKEARDMIITNTILSTLGVVSIDRFDSVVSPTRVYGFTALITTLYGTTMVSA